MSQVAASVAPATPTLRPRWPGLAVVLALAIAAWLAGRALPLLGGAVCAILLGVLLRLCWTPQPRHRAGIDFSARALPRPRRAALGPVPGFGEKWLRTEPLRGPAMSKAEVRTSDPYPKRRLHGRCLPARLAEKGV